MIPARGGSKGVPRKNLRDVGRQAAHRLDDRAGAGRAAPSTCVVSTDDEEIAAVARDGRRPGAVAAARTSSRRTPPPTEPVVRHAIEQVDRERGRPDAVMLLQATSPVRHDDTLARALAEFADTGVDSMVGVVEQPPFLWQAGDPPTATYDVDRPAAPPGPHPRPLRYRETGSLYVTRTEVYEQHDNRLGGRIGLFVMAEDEGIDIDTELDVARWRSSC